MNEWPRPVSEYRGEFNWNYKEGFSREGRREKETERLSADLKQLRLATKKEKEHPSGAVGGSEWTSDVHRAKQPAVMVDMHGDEYEVFETAKEALERLVKSDHRLASKYQNYVKKLDARLKPYGTSYDSSFMKSRKLFPSIRAYEMAAEEFEKNQDILDWQGKRPTSENCMRSVWESKLAKYGQAHGPMLLDGQCHSSQLRFKIQQDQSDQQSLDELEVPDLMRQKWVDTAHGELSKKYKANRRSNEEAKERSKDIVPLWLRRSLQRQGLL